MNINPLNVKADQTLVYILALISEFCGPYLESPQVLMGDTVLQMFRELANKRRLTDFSVNTQVISIAQAQVKSPVQNWHTG